MTNKFNSLSDEDKIKVKKHLYGLFFNDIISFSFIKKDGLLRPSLGCLDKKVIEESGYVFKNENDKSGSSEKESKPLPLNLFKYFDIEKNTWRSFNLDTLVEVMEVKFDSLINTILEQE